MELEFAVLSLNEPLPDLLQPDGHIKLLPSSAYDAISHTTLRVWCNQNARYGVPTLELVGWLQQRIGSRFAIGIGSGHGDLEHHLGIHATDSKNQEWPEIRAHYAACLQPTIQYPQSVERIDGDSAWAKFKPDVVIGSWVTQWVSPDEPPPPGGGSIYGIHKDLLVSSGTTFIQIGNEAVHGRERIMALPHETYELPFLRSRAASPNLNRVWIWNG